MTILHRLSDFTQACSASRKKVSRHPVKRPEAWRIIWNDLSKFASLSTGKQCIDTLIIEHFNTQGNLVGWFYASTLYERAQASGCLCPSSLECLRPQRILLHVGDIVRTGEQLIGKVTDAVFKVCTLSC